MPLETRSVHGKGELTGKTSNAIPVPVDARSFLLRVERRTSADAATWSRGQDRIFCRVVCFINGVRVSLGGVGGGGDLAKDKLGNDITHMALRGAFAPGPLPTHVFIEIECASPVTTAIDIDFDPREFSLARSLDAKQ